MDAHFNAYKARYEILDDHIQTIRRSQYVNTMDIFINFDDVFWNIHRPWAESEAELMGIGAVRHMAVDIVNLIAHYRKWAYNNHIRCRVYGIYTSSRGGFKNSIYLPSYRDRFSTSFSTADERYRFVNDAIAKGTPIAKSICDYVEDVFFIDSHYLEPSMIPYLLKKTGKANHQWGMIISRDLYDLQYAYQDNWIYVMPKGDNTSLVSRHNLWNYVAAHEKVTKGGSNMEFYNHNIYPLGLAVVGDTRRTIPRLKRIGWKTLYEYLDKCTERETLSTQIVTSRFLDLLQSKGVTISQVENNLSCVNVITQANVVNDIDAASIFNQLKNVADHTALDAANDTWFSQYPINIPFLVAGSREMGIFSAFGH